jgi:hypothetical protein
MVTIDTRPDYERQLEQEFHAARVSRERWEEEWRRNEVSLLDTGLEDGALRYSPSSLAGVQSGIPESQNDASDNFMGLNLSARNAQLLHSQLTSNAPIMATIPQSKDREDREAATGHEKALQHIREVHNTQNWISLGTLQMFYYGTGCVKQIFDSSLGAYDVSAEGTIKPIGDIKLSVPSMWDIWFDANARTSSEVKIVWERLHFDYDTAKAFFGEEACGILATTKDVVVEDPNNGLLLNYFHGTVEVYERWEIGTPGNKYRGSLIYHTKDGRILKEMANPCKFRMFPKSASSSKVRVARLPYTIFTYEDIPGSAYGRSPAAKCNRAQRILNACVNNMIATARNMGTPRLMVARDSVAGGASLTDDSIQVIDLQLSAGATATGSQFPAVLQGANTSQDMKIIVEKCEMHINEQWGINDALLGKQGRETQGITLQLSLQQGNLIRERMFDKYVAALKDFAQLSLSYAVDSWTENKWKLILGREDEGLLASCLEADVEGGYSIFIERNMLIALDPISRQEQLLRLFPILVDAGMDKTYLIRLFKIADHKGIYDVLEQADTRAKHNIQYIRDNNGELPKIYKYEKHINICAYLQEFINTVEFEGLPENIKDAINQLIDMRMQLEAQKMTQGSEAPQAVEPQQPQMMGG